MAQILQGPAIVCIEVCAATSIFTFPQHNWFFFTEKKNKIGTEHDNFSKSHKTRKIKWKNNCRKADRTDSFIIIDCLKLLSLSWEGDRRRRHNNTHIWTSEDWFSALVVDLPYARGRLTLDSSLSLWDFRILAAAFRGECTEAPSETGPNAGFTQTLAARARREWVNQNQPPAH